MCHVDEKSLPILGYVPKNYEKKQLDVDLRRGDDASQMSSYRFMLRPSYLKYFSSLAQVEIQFQFKKKIKFLGFQVVALVKTFPLMYQLLM